jgi:hypothetical protein
MPSLKCWRLELNYVVLVSSLHRQCYTASA